MSRIMLGELLVVNGLVYTVMRPVLESSEEQPRTIALVETLITSPQLSSLRVKSYDSLVTIPLNSLYDSMKELSFFQ